MSRSSTANTCSTGPNMTAASRSLIFRATSTGNRGSRLSETKLASRSRSAWSGPAIADSPSRSLRLRQMRVRVGDQSDPPQHLRSSRRGTAALRVDVQQHALGLRQRNVSIEAHQSMVEMELLLIAAEHQRRHLHHFLGPDLVQEGEMRFRCEVRATASQIIAINPDISDEGVG